MILRTKLAIALASQLLVINTAHAEFVGDVESSNSAIPVSSSVVPAVDNNQGLEVNAWYKAKRGAILAAVNEKNEREPLVLTEESDFSIEDIQGDKVQIVIGTSTQRLWVPMSDLLLADPSMVNYDKAEDQINWDNEDDSDFAQSEVASRHGHGGRRRGKMTYCLRDVRNTARRFTKKVPQGVPMASMAYPKYRAAGWRPTSYSPSNPAGTACFFGGGRSCGRRACGHAAIKIGSNAWKGAGVKPTPFISGRYMIGCLVPPGH